MMEIKVHTVTQACNRCNHLRQLLLGNVLKNISVDDQIKRTLRQNIFSWNCRVIPKKINFRVLFLKETLIKATLPGFFVREAATPKFASS